MKILDKLFLILILGSCATSQETEIRSMLEIQQGTAASEKLTGQVITAGQYPYHSRITILGGPLSILYRAFCNGGLITRQHILTAGQCILDETPILDIIIFYIELGSLIAGFPNQADFVSHSAAIRHPAYNPNTYAYDIAIIKTKTFTINEHVNYIPIAPALYANPRSVIGSILTITGYGIDPLAVLGGLPILQATSIGPLSSINCGGLNAPSTAICAMDVSVNLPCVGDAGSPVITVSDSTDILVGQVSFGIGTNCLNGLGINMVPMQIDWINEQTQIN
ncbi:hypothetical protein DMENIID0001_022080 [Sergentomyia squamirostris]